MATPADGTGGGGRSWDAPAIQREMVQLYVEQRLSIRQVAGQMGCAYGTAHRVLQAANVQMRPKGRPAQQTPTTPAQQRPRQDGGPR
ncbi:helix-turn-helix domain-containing protein [Dactylosporangium sp. NPDC005572]|uniref:helix-turn-helix domain-containing protein n=1 Tax=Dactylosporangium sp. NPDC005572 TaxID=3156889 RepID=UPI0033A237B6